MPCDLATMPNELYVTVTAVICSSHPALSYSCGFDVIIKSWP